MLGAFFYPRKSKHELNSCFLPCSICCRANVEGKLRPNLPTHMNSKETKLWADTMYAYFMKLNKITRSFQSSKVQDVRRKG